LPDISAAIKANSVPGIFTEGTGKKKPAASNFFEHSRSDFEWFYGKDGFEQLG